MGIVRILINKINRIYPILFKGTPYPIVETEAVHDDDTEPTIENFATEELARELFDSSGWPVNDEAEAVSDGIYDYIPDELLKKPIAEICDWISDNID